MSRTAALSTLEIVALLLTLLFIAVQFASRQMTLDRVPDHALAEAMRSVIRATFLLLFTSLFATLVVVQSTDDNLTMLMIAFLHVALMAIVVSIRNTAEALLDSLESDEPTAKLNLPDDQTTIEDYDG